MPENEKVIVLRKLIVEEFFRQNRHVYEPFLVTSTDFMGRSPKVLGTQILRFGVW